MPRARKVQPIRTPTGLPYGEKAQLADNQRNQPLPDTKPLSTPQVTSGPGLNAAAGAPEQQPQSVNDIARNFNFQPVGIGNPSQRPNEPVTHGIALGPGGGPEVLGPTQSKGVSGLLSQLATQSGSRALAQLAQHAAHIGQ